MITWIVQGLYAGRHGWEDLTAEDTRREAQVRLREYEANEPQYQHRLIARRVPLELSPYIGCPRGSAI